MQEILHHLAPQAALLHVSSTPQKHLHPLPYTHCLFVQFCWNMQHAIRKGWYGMLSNVVYTSNIFQKMWAATATSQPWFISYHVTSVYDQTHQIARLTSHQMLGPALASLFGLSVDFPELFLKTSELFLKSLGHVEQGQELFLKSSERFLKILGNPQSYS